MSSKFILEEMDERIFTYPSGRQKWTSQRRNFAIGDLVLVVDEKSLRGHWPTGLIEEVFPDSHGHVCHVKVRTATSVNTRDIRKLCLLEGVQNL